VSRSRKPSRKGARNSPSTRPTSKSRSKKKRIVKRASRVAPKQVTRAASLVPEVALLSHTHPSMKALGAKIARLRARKESDYLAQCLEVGIELRRARTRLRHGSWEPWLRDSASLTPRSARRYVALSTWAQEHPRQLARWSTLGASKLFVVASASDSQRAKLTKHRLTELRGMGVPELRLLLARLAAGKPPPSPAQRWSKLRRRLRGVVRDVHELIDADALDPEQLDELRDMLTEASEALHG
jgi:hypothetical protein